MTLENILDEIRERREELQSLLRRIPTNLFEEKRSLTFICQNIFTMEQEIVEKLNE